MDRAIHDAGTRKQRGRVDPSQIAVPSMAPTREAIAVRAYELYLERGGEQGADIDDWLRAERELTTRNNTPVFES